MNNCGYYTCYKGIQYCKKEKCETTARRCDWCKRRNGGIYPHQLPTVKIDSSEIEVIDRNGNLLS